MVLKGFLLAVLALCVSHVVALSLTNSKWIWKDSGYMTVPPFVTADFRRHFTSPHGKQAVSADILIAGDNNYTLYVNGKYIGQGFDWEISQEYCVRLNHEHNLFAVADENQPYKPGDPTPNPAAFIAAIQVNYHDGTSDTIITDSEWLAHSDTPGFEKVKFNDADWKKAFVAGSASSSPWHVPYGPFGSSSLGLNYSYWVWTNEVPPNSPNSDAPVGSRAFRKTIKVPSGVTVRTGTIIIDADNAYSLYINGDHIGSSANWEIAQRWTFTLGDPAHEITLAVNATNFGGPAGLIAAIALDAADCSCSSTLFYITDGTWKFDLTVPPGFEEPDYNDAHWGHVVIEGPYGVKPWGPVPVQNGISEIWPPVSYSSIANKVGTVLEIAYGL